MYRRSAHCSDLSNETLFARRSLNYGTAEFLDEQWRLTDLVPLRLSTHFVILLAGTAIIAGLEMLYFVMPQVASMTTDGRVAAFDLDGEGSLAAWFSSTILLLSAATAILVFTVRRFRCDDYHGRYRVWIWAALVFVLMSIDEGGSLHEGFKELMTWTTGNRVFGDGSVWWVAAYFCLLGPIGSRLVADMRTCGTSTLALFAAAMCYVLAIAAQLEGVLPQSGARGVMLEEGAEMFGNMFLFLAMLLHARFVVLDAEGLLPNRRSRSLVDREGYGYEVDRDEEEGWATVDEDEIVVHPPRGLRRLLRSRTNRLARPEVVVEEIVSPVNRKLTRQEKMVLRQKLEKARRLREEGLT